MRIWLITIGELLPTDPGNQRLMRTGLLGKFLVAKGHEVIRWTSTFNHSFKQHRAKSDTSLQVEENYRIILLHGPGYIRNVSLRRILDHRVLAAKFSKYSRREHRPDVILCSLPPLETAVAAVKFGKEVGVPVVLDVRDMWPDVLWHKTPPWAKSLVKCATIPWARLAKSACRGAFAIIGHAPAFMEWGLAHAGGPRTAFDRDFPLGYELSPPSPEEIAASEAFWASKGISRDSEQSIVCFIGTIGPHVQLDVILNAARLLNGKHQIQFVICGEGGQLEHYRQAANDLPNVLFPGWIERSPIWTLLHISKVALLSYIGRPDFIVSFPNKFAEYISAGLPIAIGYDSGIAYDLLVETNSGFSYHGSADELAIKLVDLLQSPDQLQQMSANATDLFLKRFQAEKVYGEMVVYLEEVARNSRRKVNH